MKTRHKHSFTEAEALAIGAVVEMIIPASEEYNVPAASDAPILADILETASPQHTVLADAIAALDEQSQRSAGSNFAALDDDGKTEIIEEFRRAHAAAVAILMNVTAQCYYRDDRVMKSLDMEARAPFPEGFEIEQGDWTLLDPVRKREPIWRKV